MRTSDAPKPVGAAVAKAVSPGELSRILTHELRSPLAGMVTTARLLRRALHGALFVQDADADAAGQPASPTDLWWRHCLDAIDVEARRLERVVQSLLGLAQSRQPQLERVEAAQALSRVRRAVGAKAAATGVHVRVEVPETPLSVLADAELLQQAFLHLADNAIQAMPRGGSLVLRARRPDAGSSFACIEFADSGCGIPQEDVPRVFQPFFSRRADGLGLGLAAAAAQVQAQGGHIAVESTAGAGSCFTVSVRCADQPTMEAEWSPGCCSAEQAALRHRASHPERSTTEWTSRR